VAKKHRHVFFVSDSTGITAETLGNSLLSQFQGDFVKHRTPFVTTAEIARSLVEDIEQAGSDAEVPLVFMTVIADDIRDIILSSPAISLDLVGENLAVLERTLKQSARRDRGLFHSIDDADRYRDRISAVEFSIEHDDGESMKGIGLADVILIAPSRCGKTPTTMYLAVNYGVRAANVPLLEEDLMSQKIPEFISAYRDRIFGLLSTPQRLHHVRQERRPNSDYSSLQQCTFEIKAAEHIYVGSSIPFLDTSDKSIEEISATVISTMGLSPQRS
jgi:[pyruvate, water dikinase]-phosphate phosphotransferase / [pyruvate, water dikinase] kinase